MPLPAPHTQAVFRVCVANALRAAPALMTQLVQAVEQLLTSQQADERNRLLQPLLTDGLRLLRRHEAHLVPGFAQALLESITKPAQAPETARAPAKAASAWGELTLMDDSQMQAQVDLARVQQSALHATDTVLCELDTYVSAALGLRRVRPECNPLRPENYIRALQQAVGATGVAPGVRQLWMQHMRELLGKLLAQEYTRTIAQLRAQGVRPVGYVVLSAPAGKPQPPAAPASGGDGDSTLPDGEDLLGMDSLLQLLADGAAPGAQPITTVPPLAAQPITMQSATTQAVPTQPLAGQPQAPAAPRPAISAAPPPPLAASGQTMAPEPVYDLAGSRADDNSGWDARRDVQSIAVAMDKHRNAADRPKGHLRGPGQIVNRFSDPARPGPSTARPPAAGAAHDPLPQPAPDWQDSSAPAAPAPTGHTGANAQELLTRMLAAIAQDMHRLPPLQQALRALAPALAQLVPNDARFFSDGAHPARRLLDALAQRGLAFGDERAPGFARFMHALTGAVAQLCAQEIRDAAPFAAALASLQSAWDAQQADPEAGPPPPQQQPPPQQPARQATQATPVDPEQRQLLANEIAEQIRQLPGIAQVPPDMLAFATGPWALVIAQAQLKKSANGAERRDGPGGYLALVPLLLWSTQPRLTRKEPARLNQAIPGLLARLRRGLKSIHYPAPQTSAFLQRLVGLHQAAFEGRAPAPVPASVHASASAFMPTQLPVSPFVAAPAPASSGATPAPTAMQAPASVAMPEPASLAAPASGPAFALSIPAPAARLGPASVPVAAPGPRFAANAQTPEPAAAAPPPGAFPESAPTPHAYAPAAPQARSNPPPQALAAPAPEALSTPAPQAQPKPAAPLLANAKPVALALSKPTAQPHPAPAADAAHSRPAPDPQAPAPQPGTAPGAHDDFVIGAWVELSTHGRAVRTQLTWVNPQGTLFLFTAPDASTQSMTRRMRDKFAAEGLLRVLPPAPPPEPDPPPERGNKAPDSRLMSSFFPSSLFPSSRPVKPR